MKRVFLLLIAVLLMFSTPALAGWGEVYSEPTPTPAPTAVPTPRPDGMPDEITFRNIPWGSTFSECDGLLSGWFWPYSGRWYKTYGINEIIYGKAVDFGASDINLYTNDTTSNPYVAGYVIKDMSLYFAFVPDDNNLLTHQKEDTALYAASYTIETKFGQKTYSDLYAKLESMYGTPGKHETEDKRNLWGPDSGITYDTWYGGNDTRLVLKWIGYNAAENDYGWEDEVIIIYVWDKGDELLQTAANCEIDADLNSIGIASTDGL